MTPLTLSASRSPPTWEYCLSRYWEQRFDLEATQLLGLGARLRRCFFSWCLLGRCLFGGCLLGRSLLRRRLGGLLGRSLLHWGLTAVGSRLDTGLQLGEQIGHVFGLVELLGPLLGGKGFSTFEFGLYQLVQLVLVVVVIAVRVEVVGHRLDHLPGHFEFRRFDLDLLVQQ